ncbi:DUF6383 domain-containing protein [Parabacteroides sp. ZJ-118]|uniref:DUF6383 domain-containing protein n=1 Tax=Parabacteroides sp. ZJ-118 TaxID=2709398 RepID=UPI0013EDAF8A|nr:DUF6383 domain-containing protein [Parabacteroides sp. ZJ-118]
MNKKFSTLLATLLVAGGLGSSAFAADNTTVDLSKRIQLEFNGQKLVVGESSVRDSLALAGNPASIYDSHKQNWQLSLTPIKDANGFVTHYDVYLENQVNGAIALTKEDAAKKSLYYSPGAVVASGKMKIARVAKAAYDAGKNQLTLPKDVKFGSWKYNSATKTKTAWILQLTNDGIIKLVTGEYKFTGNNPTSTQQIESQTVDFSVDGVTYESDLAFSIAQKSDGGTLANCMLNEVGNDGFKLSFSKEVSAGSEFGNVLSANELSVVYDPVYSSARYPGLKAYNDKVKAAKAVVAEVADVKTNLESFTKEMKVALTAAVRVDYEHNEKGELEITGKNKLSEVAPNLSDVEETGAMLASDKLAALFAASQKQSAAITKLLSDLDGKNYAYTILNEDGLFEVKDAATEVKGLEDAVKEITDGLDEITTNASAAIAKVDAAAQDFVKDNYKKSGITELSYEDYKVKVGDNEVDPGEYINGTLAANFVDAKANVLKAAVAVPEYTASSKVVVADFNPFAVVGEKDTYVAVDTIYVAEREKYLSLGTMTMSKYVIVKDGKTVKYEGKDYAAGDIVPLLHETDFDWRTMQYILVPAKGKFAATAFFKAVNYDDVISSASDSLVITAKAPKNPAEGKYYKDYSDASIATDFYDAQVVIRTLGGRRELSVLTEDETTTSEVCTNTRISFEEPALATKIKNGAIYFMISKNVRDEESMDKYHVATPDSYYDGYAKEAFKNVPGTQWLAEKNNDKYTFNNRDFKASRVGNQKLFVVGDENDMIYTTAARDTFQLVEVDAVKEGHLGYKFIPEEIQKISDFVLSAVNYANMETPYYLTFDGNKDSILTATADKEKALALIPMIKDDKQVTEEYAMNDKNLSKQYYQLIAKSGKDTLYLDYDYSGEVFVTKTPEKEYLLQFRSINDNANAYEVWLGAYDEESEEYYSYRKLSYNQIGQAIAVNTSSASAFVYDLVDNSTDIYKNFGFTGTTNVIISLNGDEASKVTKVGPFASVKRTGLELRAAAKDEDFVLVMDTAFVDQKDNIRYAYYITKPIEDTTKTAWNDEKFYMVTYKDSVAAGRSNDTIKYSQDNLTRIGFVPAKRINADSLAISRIDPAAADTLNVTEKAGVTNATFAFAIDEDDENAYRIESNKGEYVSYLNGILVLGNKQQAQLFNVNTTDMNPTHNDEVTVEGVSVIAGNGTVTVQGAAGQTVTVATVLGKVVANQVVASDNATIAAPQGVVFVTVNGETTKVVVK